MYGVWAADEKDDQGSQGAGLEGGVCDVARVNWQGRVEGNNPAAGSGPEIRQQHITVRLARLYTRVCLQLTPCALTPALPIHLVCFLLKSYAN